ncbi:MAG TPA: hypothetical protein VFN74_09255 [Chloroflexota bacterium]|nr:hypothetical protein [Chloroflexota bacterium]
MTGSPQLIPARSEVETDRLVALLLEDPAVKPHLPDARVSERKSSYSGAFMVYGSWDGAPAIVKVGVRPNEARWTRAVARVDPGVLPTLHASGDSIAEEPLAWLAMERCPHVLGWQFHDVGYRLLFEAGVRFQLATRRVGPRPTAADVDVDRFCRVLRQSMSRSDLPLPEGGAALAAAAERDVAWVLSVCEVEQCHGDLHPSNAVLRVTPPDPAARALLIDVSSSPLPWAYEGPYAEIVFWPAPIPDGHPTMTHALAAERRRRGLSVPSDEDLLRLSTLYRGWHALRLWAHAPHRTHHPDYQAAARRYIVEAAQLSRSLA